MRPGQQDQRIPVAVDQDFLDIDKVPAGGPLMPELLATATPKHGLAQLDGSLQRLSVHLDHHQDFQGIGIPDHRGNQTLGIELDAFQKLGAIQHLCVGCLSSPFRNRTRQGGPESPRPRSGTAASQRPSACPCARPVQFPVLDRGQFHMMALGRHGRLPRCGRIQPRHHIRYPNPSCAVVVALGHPGVAALPGQSDDSQPGRPQQPPDRRQAQSDPSPRERQKAARLPAGFGVVRNADLSRPAPWSCAGTSRARYTMTRPCCSQPTGYGWPDCPPTSTTAKPPGGAGGASSRLRV